MDFQPPAKKDVPLGTSFWFVEKSEFRSEIAVTARCDRYTKYLFLQIKGIARAIPFLSVISFNTYNTVFLKVIQKHKTHFFLVFGFYHIVEISFKEIET